VKWVAAVDPNPEALAACQSEGAGRCSSNIADAIADDVDVVVISTPNHLHAEQAVAALSAGKHVLLQKPIANTVDAANAIVAAADQARQKSNVTAAMYMSNFEDPATWAIKAVIDAGRLGTIQSVRARDAHRGGLRMTGQAWRGSRELTGGGSFVQLSIHSINLICWWLGQPVTRVTAFSTNRLCPGVGGDDATTAAAEFKDGTLGIFDSGYASEGVLRELYGSKGWIRFTQDGAVRRIDLKLDEPFEAPGLLSYTTPGATATITLPSPELDDVANPYNQNRMFVDRILAGQPPLMPVAAGRDDLAVVAAVYASAEQGRPVAMSQGRS
jgi:predicted dehydrogenase